MPHRRPPFAGAIELMPRLVLRGREIRRYRLESDCELFRLPSPLDTLHPSGADGVLLELAEMAGRSGLADTEAQTRLIVD